MAGCFESSTSTLELSHQNQYLCFVNSTEICIQTRLIIIPNGKYLLWLVYKTMTGRVVGPMVAAGQLSCGEWSAVVIFATRQEESVGRKCKWKWLVERVSQCVTGRESVVWPGSQRATLSVSSSVPSGSQVPGTSLELVCIPLLCSKPKQKL